MRKRSFLPIFLTVFIDLLGVGIVLPILAPLFLDPVGGVFDAGTSSTTRTQILGLLIACYPLGQFFGAPILGSLADRYGRKPILLISIAGTLASYTLFGIAILQGNLLLMLVARLFDGFTGGNISVAYSAISDISNPTARARNFGLLGMAFGLGFVLGPFVGGKLADPNILPWFDYATPFWFGAFLTLINFVTLQLFFSETLISPLIRIISPWSSVTNIVHALQNNTLRTMFVIMLILTFGFNFFTQFFQVFLIQKFQFTLSQVANIFAYIGIWIAIAQGLILPLVSQKFFPKHILKFSIFCQSFALLSMLWIRDPNMLFLIIPFTATFQGLIIPTALSIISVNAGKDSQGKILGINQSFQSLGMIIPPIISGFIVSINQNLPILIASLTTFIAWLVFVLFYGKKIKKSREQESGIGK